MYQLQIWGPRGWRVYQWDPDKLEARDPHTLATFAEADRFLKEAMAQGKTESGNVSVTEPHIAVSGRWTV